MFFLKQALTLTLLIAFTSAFSQDKESEDFLSNALLTGKQDINNQINENVTDNNRGGTDSEIIQRTSISNSTKVESEDNDGAAEITFLGPSAETKFKRGNAIQVRWTGGNPDDEYALDLFSGRFHYRHVGELKNSGTYPWIIPKDVEPGKEYKFKLTNTEDFGEYSFSETFIIKRRVPVAVWIVPGAIVVGGAVYLLFFSGGEEEPDLPAPIEPN